MERNYMYVIFLFDMKRIIGSDKQQKTRCNVTLYRFEQIENIRPNLK